MKIFSDHVSLPTILLLVCSMLLGVVVAALQWREADNTPTVHISAPGPRDGLVLAGRRVDFITLNLPIRAAEAKLGRGFVRPEANAVVYTFRSSGLNLAVREDVVSSIFVTNPALQTPEKNHVGSDVSSVLREYGDEYEKLIESKRKYRLHYWKQGIHFNIEADQVKSILVSAPVIESI